MPGLRAVFREVERKFTFNQRLLPLLRGNQGTPPFKHLTSLTHTTFRDTYFDTPTRILSTVPTGALWLRKRDTAWELKVTRSSDRDFMRASYDETTHLPEIERVIRRYIPGTGGPEHNFGLIEFCQYVTNRTEFVADERFHVALDETDFGHDVGEVEVQAGVDEEDRKVQMEIERFMEKYKWLFGSGEGKPKGKMTAYFEKFGR